MNNTSPTPASQVSGSTEKISRVRATIAKRMMESLHGSAQLTATIEINLSAISQIRQQCKDEFRAREGASLSYLPFIVRAAIEALKEFPKINATIDFDEGVIRYAESENIGIAVDTPRGLMVPVIHNAGEMSVGTIAKKIGEIGSKAREGKISLADLSGGTFTVTNYGSVGTLFDTPIINMPQVAILGTGALVRRPIVENTDGIETVTIGDMMYLSLSYDHRLVDGADAARFLGHVKARLEGGEFEI